MKKLVGYRDYGDGKKIMDEDVYQLIKQHSRVIDRLNPRKMIDMWETASLVASKDIEEPKNPKWTFYGKNGVNK